MLSFVSSLFASCVSLLLYSMYMYALHNVYKCNTSNITAHSQYCYEIYMYSVHTCIVIVWPDFGHDSVCVCVCVCVLLLWLCTVPLLYGSVIMLFSLMLSMSVISFCLIQFNPLITD